jgi:AcrR family transcriptional regulator
MSIQARRERERAERERLIVTAARELAEAEGWDAVTTRRLAEQVEYSQPVLYSHFKGKDAIMTAVALEGFADLAGELRAAVADGAAAVATVYTAFAERRPALYDAMFNQSVDLPFASPAAPAALHGDDDLGLLTETFWAALHGLATLTRNDRLPRNAHDERLVLLLRRFTR